MERRHLDDADARAVLDGGSHLHARRRNTAIAQVLHRDRIVRMGTDRRNEREVVMHGIAIDALDFIPRKEPRQGGRAVGSHFSENRRHRQLLDLQPQAIGRRTRIGQRAPLRGVRKGKAGDALLAVGRAQRHRQRPVAGHAFEQRDAGFALRFHRP